MKASGNPPKPKPKNILLATHDPSKNELHVTFGNGAIYTYSGVSAQQHKEMVSSPSMGSYFHAKIKDRHNYVKNLNNVKKKPSKK